MDLKSLSIKQIREGLKNKDFSAVELVQNYLDKIGQKDGEIGAFLEIAGESAILRAKEIDEKISKREKLPLLAGVPIAIKDNIMVKGMKCTAASKILENYKAVFDATCIKKIKSAGAVILGKTNLDEFAMGGSTENSAFKKTVNPYDKTRVPGGSSGGSAAAVASGMCRCALGSDTGGSVRQPASFCGMVGLKPTYGSVSRYGLIAFASSLDQIGPISKTIDESEEIFDIIKGRDEKDSTSLDLKQGENIGFQGRKIRVGIPKEYFGDGVNPRIKEILGRTVKNAETSGIETKEISLPCEKYALACYYLISPSEASANLARYDGVKYGFSKNKGRNSAEGMNSAERNLLENYLQTRGDGFGPEVKRRIMLGVYALSAGYYDAYYLKAQKARNLIKQDFEKAFKEVDVIFTPTSPILPFKIGERIEDPLQMYLSDIFTVSVNLAGLPAVSLPVGKIDGLPVGLQIIGNFFKEKQIFEIGRIIEKILA